MSYVTVFILYIIREQIITTRKTSIRKYEKKLFNIRGRGNKYVASIAFQRKVQLKSYFSLLDSIFLN